jgi:hypothetical protein
MGDNLFGFMYNYLGQLVTQADPFKQAAIQKVKQQLHVHATLKNQVQALRLTGNMKCLENIQIIDTLALSKTSHFFVSFSKKN